MNKYSYLDLAGIIFSLTGLLFVVEPFTETDALWCGVIIAGFFMWGLHARPKHGRFNLPVVFPPYIPRDVLLFGTLVWGMLAALTTLIMVWDGMHDIYTAILPAAAVMTAWRTCSVYAGGLFTPRTDTMYM